MKTNQRERFILIVICILGSILCFLNFKNATSKYIFLIGAIVWSVAVIVNVVRMFISYKK